MGSVHKGVDLIICRGNDDPKGVNKTGYLETHMIGVDLENILEKLVEERLNIYFPMCFQ